MAYLTFNRRKLFDNYEFLNELFQSQNLNWSIVTKLLCGNEIFLNEVVKLGCKQYCDSRISNLKAIKKLDSTLETIYIKPPPKRSIKSVVKYSDISLNSELETIKLLSEEAKRQNKIHKIIIMIEMGELREGVLREDLVAFYSNVFTFSNIKVIGLGTNLACINGVLPNHDKLIQLSLYKQLIEVKFNQELPIVSAGSSVTIPLIKKDLLPIGVNHFRVGESLFLGTNVYDNKPFEGMHSDVFQLYVEIIELIEKPVTPMGELGHDVAGKKKSQDLSKLGETSYRALIDLGLLDIDQESLNFKNENYILAGASSDVFVVDLGMNPEKLKVGDLIQINMDYLGTLRILNSKYVEKEVI